VDLLTKYIADINRYPLLTSEQEQFYSREDSLPARNTLVASNLRFVVQVANQFIAYTKSGKYTLLDLIQEGNDGLIHAAELYDPDRGYRFITYAVWWIRARIMSFIIRSHSLVKVGTTAAERHLFFKMGQIRDAANIIDTAGRTKAIAALAKKLKVAPALIIQMQNRLYWHDVSLDTPAPESSWDCSLADFIADETDWFNSIERRQLIERCRAEIEFSMQRLTEREKEIIRLRYLGEEKATLEVVASHFGLSRERIRQLEGRIFKKIKPILVRSEASRQLAIECSQFEQQGR
jgi:RNA polymerase sigma-32 factor